MASFSIMRKGMYRFRIVYGTMYSGTALKVIEDHCKDALTCRGGRSDEVNGWLNIADHLCVCFIPRKLTEYLSFLGFNKRQCTMMVGRQQEVKDLIDFNNTL